MGIEVEAIGKIYNQIYGTSPYKSLGAPSPGLQWEIQVLGSNDAIEEQIGNLSPKEHVRVRGIFEDVVEYSSRGNEGEEPLIVISSIEIIDESSTLNPTLRTFKHLSGPFAPSLEGFVNEYYAAVKDAEGTNEGQDIADWSTTYAMLDEASQEELTLEEWIDAQTSRETSAFPRPIKSASVRDYRENEGSYDVTVDLNYVDGTSNTQALVIYSENGELRRHLTEGDISTLGDYLK